MPSTSRTRRSPRCSRPVPTPTAPSPRSWSSPSPDTRWSGSTPDRSSTSTRRSLLPQRRRAGRGRPLLGDPHPRRRRARCLWLVQGQVRRLLAGHSPRARGAVGRLHHRGEPAGLSGHADDGQDRRRRAPGGVRRRLITAASMSRMLRRLRPRRERPDRIGGWQPCHRSCVSTMSDHRRRPRLGDGVLRRAGSRGRGPHVRGGRVPGHRLRHPGLAYRGRHAAAAGRRSRDRARDASSGPTTRPGRPTRWRTSWGCATCASRSTTCRRRSTAWPRTDTDWSAASASTRTPGGWPTSAGRRASSSP